MKREYHRVATLAKMLETVVPVTSPTTNISINVHPKTSEERARIMDAMLEAGYIRRPDEESDWDSWYLPGLGGYSDITVF